jgi:hypothetical protein
MGPRVICQWGRNYRCKTHGGWWTRRRRSRWSTTAEARKRSPEQRPIAGSTTTWTRSLTWRFWWKATRAACGGRRRTWCCVVIFRGVQSSRDLTSFVLEVFCLFFNLTCYLLRPMLPPSTSVFSSTLSPPALSTGVAPASAALPHHHLPLS